MRKLMAFIDGTNVLTEMGKKIGASFSPYKPSDEVLQLGTTIINSLFKRLQNEADLTDIVIIRKYWFSSHQGSQETLNHMRLLLRSLEFEPVIFQKVKDKPEKGVDMGVAREMLINAFHNNYDVALLVAGDEDYVGLVQDTKRYGPIVIGSFFREGRSPELELACDKFKPLGIWGTGHQELVAEIKKTHPAKK